MATRLVTEDEIHEAHGAAAFTLLKLLRRNLRDASDEPGPVPVLPPNWWLHRRLLRDGRAVVLLPLFFGVRLGIDSSAEGPFGGEFDGVYDYDDAHAGWVAALGWDGEGEPEGWYRHSPSGRRRPGGDPRRECVGEPLPP